MTCWREDTRRGLAMNREPAVNEEVIVNTKIETSRSDETFIPCMLISVEEEPSEEQR